MKRAVPLPTVAPALAVIILLAILSGCAATPAPRAIQATYRFEGVRTGGGAGGADEWTALREILARHSSAPPVEERRKRAAIGTSEVSDYRATVTLPHMAAADAIHADILALGQSAGRMEFGLADTQLTYRGNTVAAGVTMYVSGFATQGFRVRLFPSGEADADPIEVTAGRNGLWSAKLTGAPADGWLYGIAQDPAAKVRPRYFRIHVTTQKQETVDEAEFRRRYPQWTPAVDPADQKKEQK